MFLESIKAPFTEDEYLSRLVKSSLFAFFAVLIPFGIGLGIDIVLQTVFSQIILPLPGYAILAGFMIEVLRNSYKNISPPDFANLKKYAKTGLVSLIIYFAYLAIPVAIILVSEAPQLGQTLQMVLFITGLLLTLGAGLLVPSAWLEFAKNYEFKDAFNFSAVLDNAISVRYAAAWLFMIVFSFVLVLPQLILGILFTVTLIGIFFLPALLIYEYIVYAHLFGAACRPEESDIISGEKGSEDDDEGDEESSFEDEENEESEEEVEEENENERFERMKSNDSNANTPEKYEEEVK